MGGGVGVSNPPPPPSQGSVGGLCPWPMQPFWAAPPPPKRPSRPGQALLRFASPPPPLGSLLCPNPFVGPAPVSSSIFAWGGFARTSSRWSLASDPSSVFPGVASPGPYPPLGWPRQAHFYPGSGPDPLLHFSWAPPKLSTLFSNPMPPPPFFPGVPSRGYHLADVGSSASAWGGIFRGNPMFGLVCGSAASARRVPIWGHRFAKKGPSASKFAL